MANDRDDQWSTAIDQLYQLPLEQFTAARNALAADVRKAGDRASADRVKALAKPNLTAWALNQAWWRDQATFKRMLDAGVKLRDAHQARAAGKAADVRQMAEKRQQAVDAIIEAAIDILGGSDQVSADARHRLLGTTEALASGGGDVEPGRLTTDLQSTGLDMLSALAGSLRTDPKSPPPRPVIVSRRPGGETRPAHRAAESESAARERVAAEKAAATAFLTARTEALRAAEAEALAASKAETKARAALDAAAARLADLEQALDAAREDERAARRALSQATKAASETEMVRARTARDAAEAQRRLDEL